MPVTILLIDDSAPVREVLRVALESDGYRVLEAADGRENVRRIMARVSSRPPRISETSGL